VFNGETIAEPIVADLILHLGVPLSIRSADVHTLNGAQYGQLLISRPDDPMVCHRAIEYLKERGLTVEEVRA
ncbi:MAG: NIL domain-containing protein, partial [Christensenellales bacterium]